MRRIFLALMLQVIGIGSAQALCNAGNTVTSALTISSDCDGSGSTPLTLGTNANLTIDPGVTVSNDLWSTRNGDPIRVLSNATDVSITNYGTIYTATQWAITVNAGAVVDSITNFGRIESGFRRGIVDYGTINTITNVGIISAPMGALSTTSDVHVLNNLQGSAGGAALFASGNPLQYNIIIRSASDYGQLLLGGNPSGMSFNIYGNTGTALVTGVAASSITAGRYLNVLQGVSSLSGVTIGGGGIYSGYNYSLVADATLANSWDLLVLLAGPSTADTQASMTPNAYALRGAYSLQSAIINTGLSYDCTTFDKNGICVSAGGRVTDTNNPSTNSQGALLIASYRANEQWRIGAYLDQNLSSNDARGVNLDNSNPMGGLFAVWNQNTDGTGYQVRLAAGYSDKDVTISRSAFGATGEAGKGDSSLQSQAYSATISRGIQINDSRWIASPYLGVRYTKIKRAGYTEDSSADVTTPLTYSALSQETTTALAGVRFNGQLGDKVNLMASAGIENDIAHNTADYAATGVDGLTPITFNQNIRHIRPVASAGASYAIDKRQTVGANVNFRQEAFNSTNSVSGMVTYQVGF